MIPMSHFLSHAYRVDGYGYFASHIVQSGINIMIHTAASRLSVLLSVVLGLLSLAYGSRGSIASSRPSSSVDGNVEYGCFDTDCSIREKLNYIALRSSAYEKVYGNEQIDINSGGTKPGGFGAYLRGLSQSPPFCDLCPQFHPAAKLKEDAENIIVNGLPGDISCQEALDYWLTMYYLPPGLFNSPRTTCDDKVQSMQRDFCGVSGLHKTFEAVLDRDDRSVPPELICSDSKKDRCAFDTHDKELQCFWSRRQCTWDGTSCKHGLSSSEIEFFNIPERDLNVCSFASSQQECYSTPLSDWHCGSFAGMERDNVCFGITDEQTCAQSSVVVSESCEWYEKEYGRETMFPSCCDYEYTQPYGGERWCEEAGDGGYTYVADGRTVPSAFDGVSCDDYFVTKYKPEYQSRGALLDSELYKEKVSEMDAACCVPPTPPPTVQPPDLPASGEGPTGSPTCNPLDVFGNENVYFSDQSKKELDWYPGWDGRNLELQSPPMIRDPSDDLAEVRGQGTVLIANGSAILVDSAQLYIRSKQPNAFEYVEITGRARYLEDGKVFPSSGFNLIAPTNYQGPGDDDCNFRYYQVQIRRDNGRVAVWKRAARASGAQTPKRHFDVESLSSSSLLNWIGMKFVVLAIGNDAVRLELYVDVGNGWEQAFSFIDKHGLWATTSDLPSDCDAGRDDAIVGGKNYVAVTNFGSGGSKVEWKGITVRNIVSEKYEDCEDRSTGSAEEDKLTGAPVPSPTPEPVAKPSPPPTLYPTPAEDKPSQEPSAGPSAETTLRETDVTTQSDGETDPSVNMTDAAGSPESFDPRESEENGAESSDRLGKTNGTTLMSATSAVVALAAAGGLVCVCRRRYRAKAGFDKNNDITDENDVVDNVPVSRNIDADPEGSPAWVTVD
mmetsp:Transcript_15847/g.34434  ORF Transcript_15847/g.34434 Transcript_15847/m.34434 type:complete len:894 (-) Transcript_15847:69-2750(-)